MPSYFEETINWCGETWHLIYDPADPMTVPPNLQNGILTNSTCTPVNIGSNANTFYLVVLDIEIPSALRGNEASPTKYLKGIRIFDKQPVSLATLQTNDLVYYIKKQPIQELKGSAQQFLNTLLGKTIIENEQKANEDKSWSKTLFEDKVKDQNEQTVNEKGNTNSRRTSKSVSHSQTTIK